MIPPSICLSYLSSYFSSLFNRQTRLNETRKKKTDETQDGGENLDGAGKGRKTFYFSLSPSAIFSRGASGRKEELVTDVRAYADRTGGANLTIPSMYPRGKSYLQYFVAPFSSLFFVHNTSSFREEDQISGASPSSFFPVFC